MSYHHGNLRRALLDAAARLVQEHGPQGFTMAQAAREAGVSSGAPYKHFKSRDALLQALSDEGTALLTEAMGAALAGIDHPLRQFQAMGVAYVRFAQAHPGHHRVMMEPRFAAHVDDDTFWCPLAEWVSSHPPDAALDPHHPLMLQLTGRCVVYGLSHLLIRGQFDRLGLSSERGEQLARAVTAGMGPPEGPA